jgi:hypothetical protein
MEYSSSPYHADDPPSRWCDKCCRLHPFVSCLQYLNRTRKKMIVVTMPAFACREIYTVSWSRLEPGTFRMRRVNMLFTLTQECFVWMAARGAENVVDTERWWPCMSLWSLKVIQCLSSVHLSGCSRKEWLIRVRYYFYEPFHPHNNSVIAAHFRYEDQPANAV